METIPPKILRKIVILTGAGISQESGLDTFRGADGTWNKVPVAEVATPEAYATNPGRVQGFYNARRRRIQEDDVNPNAAHLAVAALERDWSGEVLVVTQNIDNLHERAGTQNLIHMHGEALKARCTSCASARDWTGDIELDTACPSCSAVGTMRPHIVWFGEMPMAMREIATALNQCDLFVSIGTSGVVYPAAGFVREALSVGAHTVELNLEPSDGHSLFAERLYGPASQVVPDFVAGLLARIQ